MHVTVAQVYELEEALLLRSVLEAEGIEVFLPNEYTMQNTPHFLYANEGIRVQVRPEDEARAREILQAPSQGSTPDES